MHLALLHIAIGVEMCEDQIDSNRQRMTVCMYVGRAGMKRTDVFNSVKNVREKKKKNLVY